MRTCKQLVYELRPIVFKINTVTFTTESIDWAMGDKACYVAALLMHLHSKTAHILYGVRELITTDLASRSETEYPDALPVLQYLRTGKHMDFYTRNHHVSGIWSYCPRIFHNFIQYTLQELVVSTNKAFWEAAENEGQEYTKENITSLLLLNLLSCTVPDKAEIYILEKACQLGRNSPAFEELPQRLKCYFSAAAHAVAFLTNIHPNVRACLRRVILDEAHASFDLPHDYALDLVSFFKENPKLRIERRVHIWRTVLTAQKQWSHV
jgi:hypothetical protein